MTWTENTKQQSGLWNMVMNKEKMDLWADQSAFVAVSHEIYTAD